MAEALFRRDADNRNSGIVVSSAGTGAWDGSSASEGAYLVALENGLDISNHAATLLTKEVVAGVDVIFTMSRSHRRRVEELGGEGKTHVLGEFVGGIGPDAEIADPFGGDIDVYRVTYGEIESLVSPALDRLLDNSP
jgi:protein-tyrosine-phosphatase